jgi:hypothetical protein
MSFSQTQVTLLSKTDLQQRVPFKNQQARLAEALLLAQLQHLVPDPLLLLLLQ